MQTQLGDTVSDSVALCSSLKVMNSGSSGDQSWYSESTWNSWCNGPGRDAFIDFSACIRICDIWDLLELYADLAWISFSACIGICDIWNLLELHAALDNCMSEFMVAMHAEF